MSFSLAKTSSTIFGDSPAEGSSSISSFGSTMSARATASICRWPPESRPASSDALPRQVGEERVHRLDARAPLRARQDGRGERKIVGDRHAGEDVLGLRHEGEAVADQVWCAAAGDVALAEMHAAGEYRHEPGDGLDQRRLAGAVRAEDGDDLAAR